MVARCRRPSAGVSAPCWRPVSRPRPDPFGQAPSSGSGLRPSPPSPARGNCAYTCWDVLRARGAAPLSIKKQDLSTVRSQLLTVNMKEIEVGRNSAARGRGEARPVEKSTARGIRKKGKAMSIEDILQNAPRYEDIVTAYELDVRGGDLQVTASGDIAVTADGDLKWGNDRVNAMHRLVQRWCFNAPTLAGLFKLVTHAHTTKQQLDDEMNVIAPIVFDTTQITQRFHDINNEIGAYTFGGAVCAGAIMVVLHNLLMRFRMDLNATKDKWEKSSPQIGGCSLG